MAANRVASLLVRAFLVALWLVAATFTALALPPPWEGVGGRDFRPQGATLAVILFASALLVRYALRWSWLPILLGLAGVDLLALVVIAQFSGASLLDPFNLRWWALVNLFIGLPWLAGAAAGEIAVRLRSR